MTIWSRNQHKGQMTSLRSAQPIQVDLKMRKPQAHQVQTHGKTATHLFQDMYYLCSFFLKLVAFRFCWLPKFFPENYFRSHYRDCAHAVETRRRDDTIESQLIIGRPEPNTKYQTNKK